MQKAIDTYGSTMQEDICIEEMSELTKALLKLRRGYENPNKYIELRCNIIEEIADVQIMLDQMRVIFGDTVQQENFKLNRLKERLSHADD